MVVCMAAAAKANALGKDNIFVAVGFGGTERMCIIGKVGFRELGFDHIFSPSDYSYFPYGLSYEKCLIIAIQYLVRIVRCHRIFFVHVDRHAGNTDQAHIRRDLTDAGCKDRFPVCGAGRMILFFTFVVDGCRS